MGWNWLQEMQIPWGWALVRGSDACFVVLDPAPMVTSACLSGMFTLTMVLVYFPLRHIKTPKVVLSGSGLQINYFVVKNAAAPGRLQSLNLVAAPHRTLLCWPSPIDSVGPSPGCPVPLRLNLIVPPELSSEFVDPHWWCHRWCPCFFWGHCCCWICWIADIRVNKLSFEWI